MTIHLTKRDKVLLYVMAIVLIVFGFLWFWIFPQIDRSSELDTAIADLEAQQIPMKAAIESLPGLQQTYDELVLQNETALQDIYPYMQNYELDKMMVAIFTGKHGLEMQSLTMSNTPAGVFLMPYTYARQTETLREEAVSYDVEDIPILTSTVTAYVTGNRANLQRAIDDLSQNYPSLRVSAFTFTENGEQDSLSIVCEVYMQLQ